MQQTATPKLNLTATAANVFPMGHELLNALMALIILLVVSALLHELEDGLRPGLMVADAIFVVSTSLLGTAAVGYKLPFRQRLGCILVAVGCTFFSHHLYFLELRDFLPPIHLFFLLVGSITFGIETYLEPRSPKA